MGDYFKSVEALPSIDLVLKPVFSDAVPTAIDITMRLYDPHSSRFKNGKPLLGLPLKLGTTPTARYDGKDDILASDNAGDLILTYKDGKDAESLRYWYANRDPEGEIVLCFTAPYRKTDENTLAGPRIDLRLDPGGGLVGQGIGFIPVPPALGSESDPGGPSEGTDPTLDPWELTLNWDLSESPRGTKGASCLGDVLSAKAKGSLSKLISHSPFAVGPLQRYPPWGSPTIVAKDREFAMYWLGTPPFDMDNLVKTTQSLFTAIANYFSSPDPFRVFIRKVYNGNGGTGATDSFILEYDDLTVEATSTHALAELLAHETVHEFALMEDAQGTKIDQWWYDEGVASYIGAIGGYTGGGWSRTDMVQSLNDRASAYYTSPAINYSLSYVAENAWEQLHAMRVMYYRSFVYLAQVNGLIAEATQGAKGIDDIIQELYRRRVKGEHHRIDEFREMLRGFIGKDVELATYEALHRGDLIVPPADCLSKLGLKLVRQDAEKFELGFDTNSMRTKKVSGLLKGSRADLAGVREGDEVVRGFMVWGAADSMENLMQVTVKRDEKEKTIKFWPRSDEKVECYMWVDITDHQNEL